MQIGMLNVELMKEGDKKLKNGQSQEAITLYINFLKSDGTAYQIFCAGGSHFKALGDMEESTREFQVHYELNNILNVAQYLQGILFPQIGISYNFMKMYDKAVGILSAILIINIKFSYGFYERGNAYYGMKNYENAIQDYNQAIKLNQNFYLSYFNRGKSFQYLNQHEEAIKSYDRCIEINPVFAEAYMKKGNSLTELNRKQEALDAYFKAIEVDPINASAYYNIGYILDDLNRKQEAIAAYDKAIQINPIKAQAYFNKGLVLRDLNYMEEALDAYNKAIEIDPKDCETYYSKGNVLRDLSRFEEALEAYNKAIEMDSQKADAYYNKGNVLKYLNRKEEALITYNKAIEIDHKDGEGYYNKGNALHDLKRYEEALVAYEMAIQINSDVPLAYILKGDVLCDLNRKEEAIIAYDMALQIDPHDADAQMKKGNALSDLNRKEEALVAYEMAILIDPKFEPAQQKVIQLKESTNFQKERQQLQIDDVNQIIKPQKEGDNDKIQKFLSDLDKRLSDLEKKEDKAENRANMIDRKIQQLKNLENNKIQITEQQLNENQQKYYRSFYWRLTNFLNACNSLVTQVYSINEYTDEIILSLINVRSKLAATAPYFIPISVHDFQLISHVFDISHEQYHERRLGQRIDRLTSLMQLKTTNLNAEVKLAGLQLALNITDQELNELPSKSDQFSNYIDQIIKADVNPDATNIYYKLGLQHCLLVLIYLENNVEQFKLEQKLELNSMIINGARTKLFFYSSVHTVSDRSCCTIQ